MREKTEELSLQLGETSTWSQVAGLLEQAALDVCGKRTKFVANPWTLGHEDELAVLHNTISTAVLARNAALEQGLPLPLVMSKKNALRQARHDMKCTLRTLEREWWDVLTSECQAANEQGQVGTGNRE